MPRVIKATLAFGVLSLEGLAGKNLQVDEIESRVQKLQACMQTEPSNFEQKLDEMKSEIQAIGRLVTSNKQVPQQSNPVHQPNKKQPPRPPQRPDISVNYSPKRSRQPQPEFQRSRSVPTQMKLNLKPPNEWRKGDQSLFREKNFPSQHEDPLYPNWWSCLSEIDARLEGITGKVTNRTPPIVSYEQAPNEFVYKENQRQKQPAGNQPRDAIAWSVPINNDVNMFRDYEEPVNYPQNEQHEQQENRTRKMQPSSMKKVPNRERPQKQLVIQDPRESDQAPSSRPSSSSFKKQSTAQRGVQQPLHTKKELQKLQENSQKYGNWVCDFSNEVKRSPSSARKSPREQNTLPDFSPNFQTSNQSQEPPRQLQVTYPDSQPPRQFYNIQSQSSDYASSARQGAEYSSNSGSSMSAYHPNEEMRKFYQAEFHRLIESRGESLRSTLSSHEPQNKFRN